MRKYLFLLILVAITAHAQDPFMDGVALWDLTSTSGNNPNNMGFGPSLSSVIDDARTAYWDCGDCPNQQALFKDYMDQLGEKDTYYLMRYLSGDGSDLDPSFDGLMRTALKMQAIVDAGIESRCRDLFRDWVAAVQGTISLTRDGVISAMQKPGAGYDPYVVCRNEAEFNRQPLLTSEIVNPEMYVVASYYFKYDRRRTGERAIAEQRELLGDELVDAVLDAIWVAAEMQPGEWHEVIPRPRNRAIGCDSMSARGCFSFMTVTLGAGKKLYREPDPDIPVSPLLDDLFTDDPDEDYAMWLRNETFRKSQARAEAQHARAVANSPEDAAMARAQQEAITNNSLGGALAGRPVSEAPQPAPQPVTMAANNPAPPQSGEPAAAPEPAAPRANAGSDRVLVSVDDVKRQWAPAAGKYQAIAEFCAGEAMPELKADFFAAFEDRFPGQSDEVEPDYTRAYDERQAKVAKKKRCPDTQLNRTRKGYKRAMDVLQM